LLPWYVTNALDSDDHARVAAHLKTCRDCTAQLEADAKLGRDLMQMPRTVEGGWAQMCERLGLDPAVRAGPSPARDAHSAVKRPRWPKIGWTVGAQAVFASILGAILVTQVPRYAALDGGVASSEANLIVIFRPETTERSLRQALMAVDARLVDGPTSANAYLLHVPGEERERMLGSLRAMPQIVMAEPIEQATDR
jgi:hypothetical protein